MSRKIFDSIVFFPCFRKGTRWVTRRTEPRPFSDCSWDFVTKDGRVAEETVLIGVTLQEN